MKRPSVHPLILRASQGILLVFGGVILLNAGLFFFLPKEHIKNELARIVTQDILAQPDWQLTTGDVHAFFNGHGFVIELNNLALTDAHQHSRLTLAQSITKISLWPLLRWQPPNVYQSIVNHATLNVDQSVWDTFNPLLLSSPNTQATNKKSRQTEKPLPFQTVNVAPLNLELNHLELNAQPIAGILNQATSGLIDQAVLQQAFHPSHQPSFAVKGRFFSNSTKLFHTAIAIKHLPNPLQWNASAPLLPFGELDGFIKIADLQLHPFSQWLNSNLPLWTREEMPLLAGNGVLHEFRIQFKSPLSLQKRINQVFKSNPLSRLKASLKTTDTWNLSFNNTVFQSGAATGKIAYEYSPLEGLLNAKKVRLFWTSKHHRLNIEARHHQNRPWNAFIYQLDSHLEHLPHGLLQWIPNIHLTDLSGHLHAEGELNNLLAPNHSLPQWVGNASLNTFKTTVAPRWSSIKPIQTPIHLDSAILNGTVDALSLTNVVGTIAQAPITLSGNFSPHFSQWDNLAITLKQLPFNLLHWLPTPEALTAQQIKPWAVDGSLSVDATIHKTSDSDTPTLHGHINLHPSYISIVSDPVLQLSPTTINLNGHQAQLALSGTLLQQRFTVGGPIHWSNKQLTLTGKIPHFKWNETTRNTLKRIALHLPIPSLPDALNNTNGEGHLNFFYAGPFSNPLLTGNAEFESTYTHHGQVIPLAGQLSFTPDHIQLPEFNIRMGQEGQLHLSGNLNQASNRFLGVLDLHRIQLSEVLTFIRETVPDLQTLLKPIRSLQGVVDGSLTINHDLNANNPQISGHIQSPQVTLALTKSDTPITLTPLALNFSPKGLLTQNNANLQMGPIKACLNSQAHIASLITSTPQFMWNMETYPIPLRTWKTQSHVYKQFIKAAHLPIPSPKNSDEFDGYVSLYTTGNQNKADAQVTFTQATIHPEGSWALSETNGIIALSSELNTPHPTIAIRSTDLTGQVQNGPMAHILLQGEWQPNTESGFLNLTGHLYPHIANALTPNPPETSSITPSEKDPAHEKLITPLVSLDIQTTLTDNKTAIFDNSSINFKDIGTIELSGTVQQVLSADPLISAHLQTPTPLQLSTLTSDIIQPLLPLNSFLREGSKNKRLLNKANQGALNIDITVNDTVDTDLMIAGKTEFQDINMPLLDIRHLNGDIEFSGVTGRLHIANLQLPGINLSMTGHIQDVLEQPWSLEDLQIKGPLFAVPAWEKYVNTVVEKRLIEGILVPFVGPLKTNELPLQFHDATIHFDEFIYDNVILEAVTGNMLLGSSGYFELINTTAHVASGDITANIAMQPYNNNFIHANISANDVKANALAQTLLNAPNQIFGILNGNMTFTTEGFTPNEQMDKVNGSAKFSITDGRLPAIAKLETVLTAANILRGGVVGLNLNNLFRVLAPFQTNYFAELSGSVSIIDGVAFTNDVLSDGENLDLLIQGQSNLLDSNSQLTIYGDMSQNVNGRLGQLGRFSLHSLIKYIPGIGYIPGFKNRSGLIQYLPGVGYVPGLGGPAHEKSRFEVLMDGPIVDPRSIKGFKWVH